MITDVLKNHVLFTGAMCCFIIISGCATVIGMKNLEIFDQTAKAYKHALSKSDYEAAIRFTASTGDKAAPPVDPEMATRYKVVSYEVKKIVVSDDKQDIYQDVELTYYRVQSMIQDMVRDRQHWHYDPELKKWILKTGLPEFK
ncbi:MAG: hypothetical protein HKM93_16265 [Desulfobacteraceae bacterium]|nr:hypothetical protein [Desulfobacteraceae bacterium]